MANGMTAWRLHSPESFGITFTNMKKVARKKKVTREKIFSIKFSKEEFVLLTKIARSQGHGLVSRVIREALFG